MGAIRLEAVEKWFDELQVIKGIDLDIANGEFVVFVGPSGCGKSTLLRMIAGLEETSRGRVVVDETDVTDQPPSRRGLAMVFQSYALYPHMTVRENMGFSLKTAGASKEETASKVDEAARALRLEDFLERRPKALSGGQRQRVAIGRSIVRDPTAFLFDEPLSNLDASLRVEMRHEIAMLHRSLGATMIYVTHDQVEAMTLADRIVVLQGGRIEQVGSPRELYERPANRFVAQFIGSPKMNLLPWTDDGSYRLAGDPERRGEAGEAGEDRRSVAELGIRPEAIDIVAPGAGTLDGEVVVREYLGADSFLLVDAGAPGTLTVRTDGDSALEPGERVGLAFDEGRVLFFDADGRAMDGEG